MTRNTRRICATLSLAVAFGTASIASFCWSQGGTSTLSEQLVGSLGQPLPSLVYFAACRPPHTLRTGICGADPMKVDGRRAVPAQSSANSADETKAKSAVPQVRWLDLVLWCVTVFTKGDPVAALVGVGMLTVWMREGSLHLQRGSMAHFALRGAILGVTLAIFIETFVGALFAEVFQLELGPVIAGLEELAKFIALIWCSWSGVRFWRRREPPSTAWPQSRRALMLAGFSVGVGFMVIEDLKYKLLFRRVTSLKLIFALDEDEELEALRGFVWYALVERSTLNVHPYLTGIAAGRFADASFMPRLTAASMWHVLWLPTVLHIACNVLFKGGFGIRFLRWVVVVWAFLSVWNKSPLENQRGEDDRKSNE